MADKKTYRHKLTGAVREYPASFGDLYEHLEPTDFEPSCITCLPVPADAVPLSEVFPDLADEEPAEDTHDEPAGSADDKED